MFLSNFQFNCFVRFRVHLDKKTIPARVYVTGDFEFHLCLVKVEVWCGGWFLGFGWLVVVECASGLGGHFDDVGWSAT